MRPSLSGKNGPKIGLDCPKNGVYFWLFVK
jgi:hypothetical protein